MCVCTAVFAKVRIRSCRNTASYPRGRQTAESVSLHYIHKHVWVCLCPVLGHQLIHYHSPVRHAATRWLHLQPVAKQREQNECFRSATLQLNFVSNPVLTHCSATKPLLFSSQALIELRLSCRSCHCCRLLWKVTCCSSPLTSFRDECRSPEYLLCACYRLCPFISLCV